MQISHLSPNIYSYFAASGYSYLVYAYILKNLSLYMFIKVVFIKKSYIIVTLQDFSFSVISKDQYSNSSKTTRHYFAFSDAPLNFRSTQMSHWIVSKIIAWSTHIPAVQATCFVIRPPFSKVHFLDTERSILLDVVRNLNHFNSFSSTWNISLRL